MKLGPGSLTNSFRSMRISIVVCGPVAQLGARFHGMEEVVGSIPTRSTKSLQQLSLETASQTVCTHYEPVLKLVDRVSPTILRSSEEKVVRRQASKKLPFDQQTTATESR